MSRTPALAVLAAIAALALAACSGGGSSANGGGAPKSVLVAPPGTILSANGTKQLGTVVVDGNINTLYRFDQDSANPPTTTCVDACAEAWPPLTTDPNIEPVLEGVQQDAVGTVSRPDGTVQVTIGGWPVYRHASDSAPAATDGNGVDGTWFAVTPDGQKAAPPKPAN